MIIRGKITSNIMTIPPQEQLPELGYHYIYPSEDAPRDLFRLEIHISAVPTEHHFDIKHIIVHSATKGTIKKLTLQHPWFFEKSIKLSAGLIVMEDRKGKKQEAFSFGGNLMIASYETHTDCVLESTAPILHITSATPTHDLFIKEVEILLATRQAEYLDHSEYETKLADADPMELYQACIEELHTKFENWHQKSTQEYDLLHYLNSEKLRLKNAGFSKYPIKKLSVIL